MANPMPAGRIHSRIIAAFFLVILPQHHRPQFHAYYQNDIFEIIGPFTLRVEFGDGISQTIDFSAVLLGQIYGPLQDLALFNKVQIDPETHTLVWPNGADFDPATLHDWPQFVEELAALSRNWVLTPNEFQDKAG